jgi:NAD(P)H-hydrate epimerase
MKSITAKDIEDLYLQPKDSHKGQNGKLLIIGGSQLFHAASLWALKVASRIVDLVHYSSTEENNRLVHDLKKEFRDGIVVPRSEVESYVEEDDAILIGPGMTRDSETDELTNKLLKKYSHKQWVIDAGALQMLDVNLIPKNAILTPHRKEFELLWEKAFSPQSSVLSPDEKLEEKVKVLATKYQCVVLVKGEVDIACNGSDSGGRICAPGECVEIPGGNSGMTKGGTGDVLAGLIAALATKNDPFLAAVAGSFINKKAGDSLYQKVGPFFNASDLADEIPRVMKKLLVY